jgi:predicted N-acetyltransferase YhbS/SAM-dependent methyltransferase
MSIASQLLAAPAATIRIATSADGPAVRAVIAAAYEQYRGDLSPSLFASYLSQLLDLEARSDGELVVAERDGRVIGTVTFQSDGTTTGFGWPPGWAVVRALAVDPSHRGDGIGRLLVQWCVDRARSLGVAHLGLHTATMMTAAIALYESLGFRPDPAHDIDADDVIEAPDGDAPRLIGYSLDIADTPDYPLGRSAGETRRLMLQHQIYAPITRQFLVAAGITRGMHVLDVGSGAGDVAMLLADLVGPEGRVTGIDINGDILDTARARMTAAGLRNVELHRQRVDDVYGLDVDAVVGRWILMYTPDPAATIRRLAQLVRTGGVVAFLESEDLTSGVRTFPVTPLHQQLAHWMNLPRDAVAGPLPDMGNRLYGAFLDAGLPAPQLRRESPIGAGAAWPGYEFIAESLRSLLPFVQQFSTLTAEQVDIDTVAQRLRDEVVAHRAIQVLPTVIGAWSQRR